MKWIRRYFFQIVSFIFVFLLSVVGLSTTSQSTIQNQKKSLEDALQRGIIECYALEGYYPESLDYLIKEYHIIYNEDTFDIDYQVIASNIKPSVIVMEK